MPMNDYMAHICMIIICITPTHQCVITDILTAISVNVWQYQCMPGNQSMYVSMYYIQINLFLSFFLLLKLFLLYFLVVKKSLL